MLHAFKYLLSRDNSVHMFLEKLGLTEKYSMSRNMKKHAIIYKFWSLLNSSSDLKDAYIHYFFICFTWSVCKLMHFKDASSCSRFNCISFKK